MVSLQKCHFLLISVIHLLRNRRPQVHQKARPQEVGNNFGQGGALQALCQLITIQEKVI